MLASNGSIFSKRPYPSPNPQVRLTEITYWSEGIRVKGLLAEPIVTGDYDGLLYLRGGMQGVGMVRPARIAQFASQGFVVFAPYYRGNRGGEGKDMFAGVDRFDAVNGVDVLRRFCCNRVHLFAFSRGGIMAIWTAILRDDITSVVSWAGVSDMTAVYSERLDMRRMMKRVIGGTPNRVKEAYDQRTPLFEVGRIQAPVLIIHGVLDVNVPVEHATKLEAALLDSGKLVETWYYEGFTHFFPPEVNRRIVKKLSNWMKMQ